MAEMIDIYDENRKHTGLRLPRKTKLVKGQFMLYVLALIQAPDGRYLITRRALNKKWAAGSWEIPGGGAHAGESSRQALCREVREETGLDIRGCPAEVIYSYRNEDLTAGDNYFVDLYLCRADFTPGDVVIQPEEVIDVRLADWADIIKLRDSDGFLHFDRLRQALQK